MRRADIASSAAVAALAALLGGCAPAAVREAQQAEQRLALVKSSAGDKDDVCKASQAVADAWLKALDQHKYQLAKVEANIACLDADMAHYEAAHGG